MASTFKEAAGAQALPGLRPEKNRNVIILDNDLLERRFGKDRRHRTSANNDDTAPAPIDPAALSFTRARIVDVPPQGSLGAAADDSLLKGIKRSTPARRAAALRLAETGRKLLENGQNRKAIYYLERALGVDASPFIHFYLARAHYQLSDHGEALRFLQVAESGFYGDPEWLPKVAAFKEALSRVPASPAAPRPIAWTINE